MLETRNAPAASPNRSRGFVALLLLMAGVLILVERLFSEPFAGDVVPLALGGELLIWADSVLREVFSPGLPAVLLAIGTVAAVRWLRIGR